MSVGIAPGMTKVENVSQRTTFNGVLRRKVRANFLKFRYCGPRLFGVNSLLPGEPIRGLKIEAASIWMQLLVSKVWVSDLLRVEFRHVPLLQQPCPPRILPDIGDVVRRYDYRPPLVGDAPEQFHHFHRGIRVQVGRRLVC